jgi:hypothetical protein
MKQVLTLTLLIFALSRLFGCSGIGNTVSEDMEIKFQAAFPDVEMNKSFSLKVRTTEKTYQLGSSILFTLDNLSQDTISFPLDSFITILAQNNGEWIELENSGTYSGELVLAPQGTPLLDQGLTGLRPVVPANKLSEVEEELLVRIVIVGEILKDNVPTGKLVGSYVDILMSQ